MTQTREVEANPKAANPAAELVYNPVAERRAWTTLVAFLTEVLR